MMSLLPCLRSAVALIAALAVWGGCAAHAPGPGPTSYGYGAVIAGDAAAVEGSLRVLDPYLHARLAVLERLSPRFRAAMDALREGDLPVYLATAEPLFDPELGVAIPWRLPSHQLGEFAAVRKPTKPGILALVVRVNLREVQLRQRRGMRQWLGHHEPPRPSLARQLEEAIDAILIHELWGHLVPVAEARSLDSHCSDPVPRQSELASCVMQRENDLRREMGLRPRTRYTFSRYARPR
jgi:hypothetical protein